MAKRFIGCFIAVALGLGIVAQASAATLVLGSVNDNVKKHLKRLSPLAAYLEKALAEVGVTKVEISVLPNSDSMVQALQSGEVDLYFDSPLVAAKVARDSGGAPMLRRWKSGVAEYHSLIFVPTESAIHGVEDLRGRRIAFQEPDSTSGYLLPMGIIRNADLDAVELPSRDALVPEGNIGYVFSGDDNNTLIWLHKGWVDAGATDPENFEKLSAARPGAYRIVARSIDVPRQVVVRRGGLDDHLVSRLHAVMTSLDESEEGRIVLEKNHRTTRYDEFPKGVEATFAPIYELLDRLAEQGVM